MGNTTTAVLAATLTIANLHAATNDTDLAARIAERIQVGDHSIQHPDVRARNLKTTVELTLDHPVIIELTPFDVRSPDFRAVYTDAQGKHTPISTSDVLTYRGTILGQPGSRVAATRHNDRLNLYIIENDDDIWVAEPLARIDANADHNACVVYKAEDLLPLPYGCGVDTPHDHQPIATRGGTPAPRGAGDCPDHQATIELTGDTAFYILEGEDSGPRLITIMNAVDMIYRSDLSLTWSLRGIEVFTNGDPWGPPTVVGNEILTDDLLNDFTAWVSAQPPISNDRDFAHLATGFNLDGVVIGRAGLGTVCTSTPATGVLQFTHSDAIDIALIAHEVRHNFGAVHDGTMGNQCPNSGFIMAAFNSGSMVFSSCSVNEITARLSRICIRPLLGAIDTFEAVDDAFETKRDTPRILDVLANELLCVDSIPTQPGSLTAPATSTAGGQLAVVDLPNLSRDVVRYTPPAGFLGTDTFTYTLTGPAGSETASVTIDVLDSLDPEICDAGFGRYQDDTGTLVGAVRWPTGTQFMWMKQFTVQPGGEMIGAIEVAVSTFESGMIALWDDPNNDGNPSDANLIASFGPVTFPDPNMIYQFAFPITPVGAPGDSFFVGAGGTISPDDTPMAVDGTPPAGRNWSAIAPVGDVPPGVQIEGNIGNFLIRAIGGTLEDCNENGLIDICEIVGFTQPDANSDGIPDFCQDLACPCEFDGDASRISVTDLLTFLAFWFDNAPQADIDTNPGVSILDLLTFLECWIPASVTSSCN